MGTVDSQPYRPEATTGTYPPHVACLLCEAHPEFFTFFDLVAHYRQVHPLVLVRREEAA